MSNTTPKIPGLLSIIVPAYNEAASIAGNVAAIGSAVSQIAEDYEIIVSDDGSTDGTFAAAQAIAAQDARVKVVETRPNAGKGWALRKGALSAKGDFIGFLDADLDLHAEQFARLYEIMLRENAHAVIGSKRHPASQVEYPAFRRAISFAYYALVRALFGLGLTDSQTGIKLFRRDALLAVLPQLVVKRFAFDIELLVNFHRRGFKIAEAPVTMRFARPLSRITPAEGFAAIRDTLAVFYRLRVLKFYDRARPVPREFPPASVIIAGGAPNPFLFKCLEACARLDYPDFEVILVLDSPPEGADRTRIEWIKTENGFDGTKKRFEVRISATKLPSVKRDEAVSASRGRLLAFIDDDAFPPQDWLRSAAANFGDPAVAAVGGPNLCPEEHTPLERCGDAVLGSLLGGGTERRRYIPRPRGYVREFPTCNLTVRREDFDAVGGFGCKFWPGEDTVLCEKLAAGGKKIAYDPDVIVYHHRRPLFRPHLAQIRRYALHRGYFVKRYPKTSRRAAFFLPTLWTLLVLLGWLPGAFCGILLVPYAAALGLYIVMTIIEGLASVGLRWFWAVALGIMLTHFVYGTFFTAGLLSPRLEEER